MKCDNNTYISWMDVFVNNFVLYRVVEQQRRSGRKNIKTRHNVSGRVSQRSQRYEGFATSEASQFICSGTNRRRFYYQNNIVSPVIPPDSKTTLKALKI